MLIVCPMCSAEHDLSALPYCRQDARCNACHRWFALPAEAFDLGREAVANASARQRRAAVGCIGVGALAAIMIASGTDKPLLPFLQDAAVVVDGVELSLSFDPPRGKTEPLIGITFCIQPVEFSSPNVETFEAKLLLGYGPRGHLNSMGAAVPTETSEVRPVRLLSVRAKTAALQVMTRAVIDRTNPGALDSARADIARAVQKRRSDTRRLGSWIYRYDTSSSSALLMTDRGQ